MSPVAESHPRDLLRLPSSSMITPKIVVVERFQFLVDWDDGGPGRVEGQRQNLASVDRRLAQG